MRHVAGLLLVVLGLAGCAASARTGNGEPSREAPLEVAPPSPTPSSSRPAADRAPVPVTHLGRTVLARCELIVRGRIHSVASVVGGTEVAQVEVLETLLGTGERDPRPAARLTVFCGQEGLLPRAGGAAVLLLRGGHGPSSYETLQIAPLSGSTGDERVEALTRYIEVELLPTEAERVEALLAYLREAALDPHPWTRDNAALEYGSLARARPDDLGALDGKVLQIARTHARESSVRKAIDAALAAAARAPGRRAPADPEEETAGPGPRGADAWLAKLSAERSPEARRELLLDGALELRDGALPLLRRGLADDSPIVCEAAVAAAGELRVEGLDEELRALLESEQPTPVRRSTIRALGYLRCEPAVPALAAIADGRGTLAKDACFALARVRSPAAVEGLRARLAEEQDTEWRELIEFLVSPAFVEQERGLGRDLSAD